MTLVSAITAVQARIRRHRLLLIALLIFIALSYACAGFLLVWNFARLGAALLLVAGLGAALVIANRRRLFASPTQAESCALLDARLGTKDRALTYANLQQSPHIELGSAKRSLIERQLEPYLSRFDLSLLVPYKIDAQMRRTLYTLPIIWLLNFYLLHHLELPGINAANSAEARKIEALLEQEAALPEFVRSELKALAKTLDQHELTDAEVKSAVDRAEAALEQAQHDLEIEAEENKEGQNDTVENSAPEATPTPVPPTPTLPSDEQAEQPRSEQKQEPQEQQKEQEQKSEESKKEQDKGKNRDDVDQQHANKSSGQGDSKDQQKQQQEQQGQSGQQQKKDGKSQDGEGQGQGKGEGQGQGESKSQKENQQQNGKQGQGAGASGSQSGEQKQQDGKQSDQGQQNQSGQNAQNQQSQNGKEQGQGALAKAGASLQDLKNKIEEKQQAQSGQGGQGQDNKQEKQNQEGKGQGGANAQSKNPDQNKSQSQNPSGGKDGKEGQKQGEEKGDAASQSNKQPQQNSPEQNDSLSAEKSSLGQPGETAKRFSDEGDSGEGLGNKAEFKETKVGNDKEQTDTRFTSKDGNLGKNSSLAKFKTTIEDVKLSRPEPMKDQSAQPVPLEYKDILQ